MMMVKQQIRILPPIEEHVWQAIRCLETFEQDLGQPFTAADRAHITDEFLDEAASRLETLKVQDEPA